MTVGSMVSDIHRILFQGGIFLYPNTRKYPQGKLRLLYECNPLSFIVEQAGGKASDGYDRIMDIDPSAIHQRVPFIIGSIEMVEEVEAMMKEHSPK